MIRENNWQLEAHAVFPVPLLIFLDDLVKSFNAFLPVLPYLQNIQINSFLLKNIIKLFITEMVPQILAWLLGCNIRQKTTQLLHDINADLLFSNRLNYHSLSNRLTLYPEALFQMRQ